MKLFTLAEVAVFVVILFVGYFYVLGKGALDWGEDDEAADGAAPPAAADALERREPIRFGNEDSGPVRLPEGRRPEPVGTAPHPAGGVRTGAR
jgi:NADH-quinone oxidoreductase subunit A